MRAEFWKVNCSKGMSAFVPKQLWSFRECVLTVMSDACFMGTPKRVGPPFMAPLAWGASSRAMMDPGSD